MKYIRKSFFLFWLIAVMLFGTVSASAASAKPETPVLSGTAAGNRVTLNWNKVKKASGYQIFLYYKAYGKYMRGKDQEQEHYQFYTDRF